MEGFIHDITVLPAGDTIQVWKKCETQISYYNFNIVHLSQNTFLQQRKNNM